MARINQNLSNVKINQKNFLNIKSPCSTDSDCNGACYSNGNCCYTKTNLAQVNDPTLYQNVNLFQNLTLSNNGFQINTGKYTLESSSESSQNDTFVINETGIYYIYFYLTYSFVFTSPAVPGNLFHITFDLYAPNSDITPVIRAQESIVIPTLNFQGDNNVVGEVQGGKFIQVDSVPFSMILILDRFLDSLVFNGMMTVYDLTLAVQKVG